MTTEPEHVTATMVMEAIERDETLLAPPAGGCREPVDELALERLLRRMESDAHRGGWAFSPRYPPRLVVIYRADRADTEQEMRNTLSQIGPILRVGCYGAADLVPARFLTHNPPPPDHRMLEYADHVAHAALTQPAQAEPQRKFRPMQLALALLRDQGVVGFAAMAEMWIRAQKLDEPAPERSLLDLPDSQEARMVTSMDLTGKWRNILRIRGEKPLWMNTSSWNIHNLNIAQSVALLADVTLGRTTTDWEQFAQRYGFSSPDGRQYFGGDMPAAAEQ